jgi:FkbM family methyltransferase
MRDRGTLDSSKVAATVATFRDMRAIRANPVVRLAALFGRRLPWLRDLPLRFHCGDREFRARPVDLHGSVIAVLVLREYQALLEFLPNDEDLVVIDAGANVGAFALFLKAEFPTARVVSVEASPVTYGLLADNVRRSGWTDWSAYHCALWDHNGTIAFDHDSFASANSSVIGEGNSAKAGSPVPARRLDGLIDEVLPERRISLLKLDIEGAEERVLESVVSLSMVDSVVIEVHAHLVNEKNVLKLLREEFPRIERLPTSDADERIYFATR